MLKNQRNDLDWVDLGPEDYALTTWQDKPYGLTFKCPGCNFPLGINIGSEHPCWKIDFVTLTADPSIKHDRQKGGCGWHGYLKHGVLEGKIE